MNKSPRLFCILLAAAILGTSVPRIALAEPVTITSGFISIPAGLNLSSPIQIVGTDGVLPFSLMGFIAPDSNIGVRSCTPCLPTATTISLAINSSGLDLDGMVTYGNDSYSVGLGLEDTFGNVNLLLTGFALLPPAPSITNQLSTVMAPFQVATGSAFHPPISGGPFGPGNALRGSGTATVSLFAEDPGNGVPVWSLRSAEYQFTPEPASFVLLASGLAGLAMQRRRRRQPADAQQ